MPITADDIKRWSTNFESQTMDLKSYDILSHADDLADLMVSFANNKFVSQDYGGRIIIGVDNSGNIENFTPKQGHEEHIVNVARDKCYPSIRPEFEKVDVDGKSVYVVTIPKMTNYPYQLITQKGRTHRIRVGSTIREPTPEELAKLYDNTPTSSTKIKISTIESSLSNYNGASRRITIIPVDSNAKLINFDKTNTGIIKSIVLNYMVIDKVTLIQNEIHYSYDEGAKKVHGIINEDGQFSIMESFTDEREVQTHYQTHKLVSIEREIVFLLSMIDYIKKVYSQFGYNQRLKIKYSHHNVQNFSFTYSDPMRSGAYFQHLFQKSDVDVEREIAFNSLDAKALVGSILEEVARSCDWPVENGYFSTIIDEFYSKCGF